LISDGRKKNRGKEKCTRWSLAVKAAAIESYMEAKDSQPRQFLHELQV